MVLSASGCSVDRSTLATAQSGRVFEVSEADAFYVACSALRELFPGRKIDTIVSPYRGYITTFIAPPLYLDRFTQKVLIKAVSGADADGRRQSGYAIDVSGEGTSVVQGTLKNERLFEKVVEGLNIVGSSRLLQEITRDDYGLDADQFRGLCSD